MQVTFSALLKRVKVLKSAGTVSDKFNSLGEDARCKTITGEDGGADQVLQQYYVLCA